MPEFPEPVTVWREHFSESFPKEAIARAEMSESVKYGELLVYVIYKEEQGTDRREIGFDPAASTDYSTQDPARYVPDEFQVNPSELDFLDPFGLVSDDDALNGEGWGAVPSTPTQTFATDVSVEPCETCEGAQVYCPNCADTDEADCTVADCEDGIVKISCGACAGTGRYDKDCEKCGGTGKQKKRCTKCNGTGEYLNDYGSNTTIHTCRECDSNNMMDIDCDACSGGRAPSGKQNVRCDGCGGTGTRSEEQCSTCSQYPETAVGTVPCPECDAGMNPPECVTCEGTGEQSVVHWVTREYNLDVEWLRLRRNETSDESDGDTKRLYQPPEFATEESELRHTSVESAQFFRDELDITDIEVDIHPTREHIQNIRHGVRSAPGATQAEGTAPWVFSTVSDEDSSGFSIYKWPQDDIQSFTEFVKNLEDSRPGGTDDDIIVPPEDSFVKVYYRLVSALIGSMIFNLEDLHKKHPDIPKRFVEVYYPQATLRETDDGRYEAISAYAGDKVEEAYESTGLLDKITEFF
jgi:hypothetical protein